MRRSLPVEPDLETDWAPWTFCPNREFGGGNLGEVDMQTGRFKLGNFQTQSGVVVQDARLSYETHGELNADRSNAIVYPTWYTGTHEDNRGAIGAGKALDHTV